MLKIRERSRFKGIRKVSEYILNMNAIHRQEKHK